jgi:signal transduction histidine kinase
VLAKTKVLYAFVIGASLFIATLSFWWLYLVFDLSSKLAAINNEGIPKMIRMLKYEGASLIIIIAIFIISMAIIFINDKRKTNALTEFFSSLTHELKTPLASMRLQSEFIQEIVEQDDLDKEQLKTLTKRLIEDNIKLENELDNTLQLSRLQRGGNLNLENIKIKSFLTDLSKDYEAITNFHLEKLDDKSEIIADSFALKLIFRNLIQNTINHSKSEKKEIYIESENDQPQTIKYYDNGAKFDGNVQMLTKLFYKHNSKKGSGIGLHLIQGLINKMGGSLDIKNTDRLSFYLKFCKA